jgi:YD repeat-containing protein
MNKKLVFAALGMFSASILLAADGDAKAEVKAAAKKVGSNYSWTSTPKVEGGGGGGNFRPGPTDGQTVDGYVYLKSSFGDRTMESAAKGEKAAFKGEDSWESVDEQSEGVGQFIARRMKTFKAPAVEAGYLVDKTTSLKSGDGVISGDLTEEVVKDLLTFGGRRPAADRPAPKDAKGSVKFWVKDGTLTKYEYNVQGKVTGRDDAEVTVNRTTTVEIKDVGTTKLGLSDEAKKKLS